MHYRACLAASMDGKINPPGEARAISLGSALDIAHLKALRDSADALVFGGKTFRSYPKRHQAQRADHRPLHLILTRGDAIARQIPPDSPFFTGAPDDAPPALIMSAQAIAAADRALYPDWVAWEQASGDAVSQTAAITQALTARGCQAPLVEGGGEIVGLFIAARALSRLYLTLCPLVLGGGAAAPSFLSGVSFSRETAPRLHLVETLQRGDELFLTLDITYAQAPASLPCP
ncbi:MAG: dihydrofolate reductase family protein [Vampirovibrionales bacterium]|nr:dihydrofolate reductase family protein [Vampirovibrionales bacterium]